MKITLWLLALALASCGAPTEPDVTVLPTFHSLEIVGEITLSAGARIQNDSVFVEVFAANTGTAEGRLELGMCTFGVVGSSGSRFWDNRLSGPDSGCPDVGILIPVPSGETRRVFLFARSLAQLGQRGGPRSYDVTVLYFDGEGTRRKLPAGSVTL